MPSLLRRLFLIVVALFFGVILGYLVIDFPIVPVATTSVIDWLAPSLKNIDAWLYSRRLDYLLVAGLVFVATIPNVVLLSFLVALAMKVLRHPRMVFYSSLIWPAIHYFVDMDKILRIMARWKRLGRDLDLNTLLLAENIPTKACGMLLIYSLYSALAFMIYRQLSRVEHNPSLNTGANLPLKQLPPSPNGMEVSHGSSKTTENAPIQ